MFTGRGWVVAGLRGCGAAAQPKIEQVSFFGTRREI